MPHRTAPYDVSKSKRWSLAFINKDMNYTGQTYCKHSVELHKQEVEAPAYIQMNTGGPKLAQLMKTLDTAKYSKDFPVSDQNPIPPKLDGKKGQMLVFGLKQSRESQEERGETGQMTKFEKAPANLQHVKLFSDLKAMSEESFGTGFFGITSKHKYRTLVLQYNVLTFEHKDSGNLGDAVLVALGEFEGGEILIKTGGVGSAPAPAVQVVLVVFV
jgi:hypothetical protein